MEQRYFTFPSSFFISCILHLQQILEKTLTLTCWTIKILLDVIPNVWLRWIILQYSVDRNNVSVLDIIEEWSCWNWKRDREVCCDGGLQRLPWTHRGVVFVAWQQLSPEHHAQHQQVTQLSSAISPSCLLIRAGSKMEIQKQRCKVMHSTETETNGLLRIWAPSKWCSLWERGGAQELEMFCWKSPNEK